MGQEYAVAPEGTPLCYLNSRQHARHSPKVSEGPGRGKDAYSSSPGRPVSAVAHGEPFPRTCRTAPTRNHNARGQTHSLFLAVRNHDQRMAAAKVLQCPQRRVHPAKGWRVPRPEPWPDRAAAAGRRKAVQPAGQVQTVDHLLQKLTSVRTRWTRSSLSVKGDLSTTFRGRAILRATLTGWPVVWHWGRFHRGGSGHAARRSCPSRDARPAW